MDKAFQSINSNNQYCSKKLNNKLQQPTNQISLYTIVNINSKYFNSFDMIHVI